MAIILSSDPRALQIKREKTAGTLVKPNGIFRNSYWSLGVKKLS